MAKKRKSKAASTSADGKTPKKSGKAKSLKSKCDENEDVDLVVSESAESAPVEWQPEDPDPTEDGDEDDEVAHGNFVKDLAALEGAPRFLHFNDRRGSDLPFAQLLSSSTKASAESKPPKVSIESLLVDLPESKSGKALKKSLRRVVQGEDEDSASKKLRRPTAEESKEKRSFKLPAPLTTPESERAARSALYTRTKEDVRVWDAVVHSSRAADTKKFPLVKPDMKLATAKEFSAAFKPRNALEEQVMTLLQGSRSDKSDEKDASEESVFAQMTWREAEEKRRDLTRLRMLQSYHEAKIKRQNKIKSKSYRKILRKQRAKEKAKEMEELQRNDPEAVLEKLQELDKTRILERASLRHRNSSKYLQMQARRGKTDKESRTKVNDQIKLHRELTAKRVPEGEKEDDDDFIIDEGAEQPLNSDGESSTTFEEKKKKAKEETLEEFHERLAQAATSIDDLFCEAGRTIQQKIAEAQESDNDEELAQAEDQAEAKEEETALEMKTDTNTTVKSKRKDAKKRSEELLDPEKFVKSVDLMLPNMLSEKDAGNEDFDSQEAAIAEAFADDDVVTDFRSEKQALVEKNKPKDIDLTLPGWGSWGGEGIKISRRKRRRFIIKAPPAPKRRDENRGHLILNEDADAKARAHQVSSVPFPFTSVSDFEASIRLPMGSTFVPRTAFKKLIKPRVEAKKGAVIDPMDAEELIKRKIM